VNILSTSDLKGAITYVNDDFVEVSGFDRDELMGKNIIWCATPMMKNGVVCECQSEHSKARAEDVHRAEKLYVRINAGKAPSLMRLNKMLCC
jgi:PAS domain S-box-containing protein